MSGIQLSVIIPAFNVQKYIFDCLLSLVQQYSPIVEIVVVNDGSSDSTEQIILSNFSKEISSGFIKLINQKNAGVSVARNTGIKHALGRYVGFVDADDFILPTYIATILNSISSKTPDIIEFGFKKFNLSPSELIQAEAQYSNRCFGTQKIVTVLEHIYAVARWYPWTRVFKKELFIIKSFPEGVRFCEDMMTIPFLYENAKTISVLHNVLYGYRINQGGATLNIKPDYYEHLISFYDEVKRQKGFRFDLMKFSIAFSLYSCSVKAGQHSQIPDYIWSDMSKLKFNPKIYFYLEWRKILILCYSSIYKSLKATLK